VREAIHGGAGVQNSASGSFAGSVPSSRSPDSHGGQPMAGRVSAYYGGLAGMVSKPSPFLLMEFFISVLTMK